MTKIQSQKKQFSDTTKKIYFTEIRGHIITRFSDNQMIIILLVNHQM